MVTRSSFFIRAMSRRDCYCLFLLWLLFPIIHSRKTSGEFVLSGVNSEKTLGSFALSAYARGWFDLMLSCDTLYPNESNLKLHFYTDANWSKFLKATTCTERAKLAAETHPLQFEYVRGVPAAKWKAMVASPLHQERESRPHYWYFVITDCSLEYQYRDGSIPKLEYTINVWNDVSGSQGMKDTDLTGLSHKTQLMSHLSADETGIKTIHFVTFFLSGLIGVLMATLIFLRIVDAHSVHLALFLVMAAAGLDSSSSLCEIIHLKAYETNGYGWYQFDALSSHFEAMCDALVTMLLLAIASGWTLPSDVVHISSVQTTWVQSLTEKLRNPMGAVSSMNTGGILSVFIVASHLILAQWGRIYNDDFDSYHDLEHLPGKLLMGLRVVLGIIMVAAAIQTKSACPPSLGGFYTALSLVGTLWFQGLPLVTWLCTRFVPYYLRHPAVTFYGSLCQSVALLLMAWLVTSHSKSSFHSVSRMQATGDDSLTDSLSSSMGNPDRSAPTQWKIGKAKVRLD